MNGIRVIESAWTTDEDTETYRRKFYVPKVSWLENSRSKILIIIQVCPTSVVLEDHVYCPFSVCCLVSDA